MSARVLSRVLVAGLLAFAPLFSQLPRPEPEGPRLDAPPYAKHGPFWVGTREFIIPQASERFALPATVWYPAKNPSSQKEAITYALDTCGAITHGVYP